MFFVFSVEFFFYYVLLKFFYFICVHFILFWVAIISPPPAAPTVRPSIPTERTSTKLDACGNGDVHWLQQQNRDAKQQEYT